MTLRAMDELGRADESTATFRVRGGKPETIDLLREHPAWIDSAVVWHEVHDHAHSPGMSLFDQVPQVRFATDVLTQTKMIGHS